LPIKCIEDPGSIKSSNKPDNKIKQTTITNNNFANPPKQKPCKEMRKNRDKLKKNPNPPQPLRNTNPVVRIARTTKRPESMEKPSKNRNKKMRTPKPMNTNIAIPREVQC